MDWDDLRYFVELARAKRLTRAGRKLGVDHTTVARRIERLEAALGCRLFEQAADGYAPTDAGQRLLERAEAIESGVGLLEEEARGAGALVRGTVRVGAPEGFGSAFLVPRLGRLLAEHPELDVEVLTLPRFPSLAAHEADIVVTIDPPEHGRYIASRLADYTYGLFASRAYLGRHTAIRRIADLAGHDFVGYLDDMLLSPQLRYLDELPPHRLRVATSGMLAQVEAVRAGLGLGVLTHYLATGAGLKAVLPREAIWKRTFWITTRTDWYRLRRVRAVWDYIRSLAEAAPGLFPSGGPADASPAARGLARRGRAKT
jgi:DNA-binding transcriptional LysR family regulator